MTKTLTEQWREGKLPQGYYYIVANTEQKHRVIFYLPERNTEDETRLDLKDQFVLEVLARVPSYEEYKELKKNLSKAEEYCDYSIKNKMDLTRQITAHLERIEQLQEQLAIATKALKGVSLWANTGNGGEQAVKKVCDKALKEMEGVK